MTRPKVEGQANQFMEVSGIDPAIVREEQQAVERANSGKQSGRDLSGIQQAVNLNKLQAQSQQMPQQFGQADTQGLFATDAPGGPDDVRYHTQQLQNHAAAAHHQGYSQMPQNAYLQQAGQVPGGNSVRGGGGRVDGSSGVAGRGDQSGDGQGTHSSGLMTALEARLSSPSVGGTGRIGKRRVRLGWTDEETRHLMEGCKRHGVGNWKKILTDPSFEFNCRTAVDLKDRFRTSFPEEYSRLYPNARTHKAKRQNPSTEISALVKINRKERRSFTPAEDERLLQGFLKHGPAWSKIQRDPSLNLAGRRSTDLRDRFRNAFPERYTAAGYKGRSHNKSSSSIQSASDIAVSATQMGNPLNVGVGVGGLDDDVHLQQHGMMQPRNYIPSNQHPLQLQGMGYQTAPTMFYGQMGQVNQNYFRQQHGGQNPQQS